MEENKKLYMDLLKEKDEKIALLEKMLNKKIRLHIILIKPLQNAEAFCFIAG